MAENDVKEKSTDEEIFFPEGKEVNLTAGKFKVKPFVLKNRSKVLGLIMEVLQQFIASGPLPKDAKNIAKNVNIKQIASIVLDLAGDKLITIYEIVLEKDPAWLGDNITMKDEVVLLETMMEVNDFPFLVKKAAAMLPSVASKKLSQ